MKSADTQIERHGDVLRRALLQPGFSLKANQCLETQGFIDQCLITSFCRAEGVDRS